MKKILTGAILLLFTACLLSAGCAEDVTSEDARSFRILNISKGPEECVSYYDEVYYVDVINLETEKDGIVSNITIPISDIRGSYVDTPQEAWGWHYSSSCSCSRDLYYLHITLEQWDIISN